MIAYVVTSGTYSEYSIERIFSTTERAAEWIKLHRGNSPYNDDMYRIEEWEVDADDALAEIATGEALWRCAQDNTGTIYIDRAYDDEYTGEKTAPTPVTKRVTLTKRFQASPTTYEYQWDAVVKAKDAEHAAKIFQDRLAQFKAEEAGIA